MILNSSLCFVSSFPSLIRSNSVRNRSVASICMNSTKNSSNFDIEIRKSGVYRRQFLLHSICGLILGNSLSIYPSIAAEKPPPLPQGAAQLDRILGAQSQWTQIGNIVSERGTELSEEEWNNIRTYLRKIYSIGDDFEYFGTTESDKSALKQLAKSFRKHIKSMDIPVKNRNVNEFLDAHKIATNMITQFFDIRRSQSDIPDEL